MAEVYRILTVDDSEMNHKIISKILGDQYLQVDVSSGKECLGEVEKQIPDLVLLDVTMPGMDGYETCQRLRLITKMKHVPILFLSGRCSVEEKLKGYEVGGDDYITKPFEAEELLAKIDKSIQQKFGIEKLTDRANKAANIAFNALKDNGNITLCLNFFKDIFSCETIDDLAQRFFKSAQDMGLASTLQIRVGSKYIYFQDDGVERELEQALLVKMQGSGDCLDFGKRSVINFDNISLLIKNVPIDRGDTGGALKDYMSTLVKGANYRLRDILLHTKLEFQRDNLAENLTRTAESLSKSETQFSTIMGQNHRIFEKLVNDIHDQVAELHMAEYQEEAIYGLVRKAETEVDQLHSRLMKVEEEFARVIQQLRKQS